MSIALIQEGLRALREQSFSYKRNPDGSIHKGGAVRTNRDIGKYMKMLKKMGKDVSASDFNRYALNALDDNKYPWGNMPDTPDTFSSDKGHYKPFKGINKDPDYYYNVPLGDQGIYTLGTGVEGRERRYPGAPTMAPVDPVVRDKDFSSDDFDIIKNHTKPRTYYDI